MIFTDALRIAMKAHDGQFDKGGNAYILHPLRVALQFPHDEAAAVVALLHDVFEDTALEIDDPMFDDLADDQRVALQLLTKDDQVPYQDYLARVAADDLAARVKLADVLDNMDLGRIPHVTAKDRERFAKYRAAADVLRAAIYGG